MVLYYHVVNGGDGSAYPQFYDTEAKAIKEDAKQYEPWAESSVGSVDLKIEDGKILFRNHLNHWIKVK